MEKTTVDPSEFLRTLKSDARDDLVALDRLIGKLISGPRVLWQGVFWGGSRQNIIGYGELNYKNSLGKNLEWFRVGLAKQKDYISIYVNALDGQKYLAAMYSDRLGKVKVGKSNISFKSLEDVDPKVLKELLQRAEELFQG